MPTHLRSYKIQCMFITIYSNCKTCQSDAITQAVNNLTSIV